MREASWTLPSSPGRPALETSLHTASPQFPGVDFESTGIAFTQDAPGNDAAIRASLVYFKHRWPGEVAVIEGSEDFRTRVWRIAEEVGVPLQGPRPGACSMTKF